MQWENWNNEWDAIALNYTSHKLVFETVYRYTHRTNLQFKLNYNESHKISFVFLFFFSGSKHLGIRYLYITYSKLVWTLFHLTLSRVTTHLENWLYTNYSSNHWIIKFLSINEWKKDSRVINLKEHSQKFLLIVIKRTIKRDIRIDKILLSSSRVLCTHRYR